MGLLTGFSLISGVEILYFSGKILLNIFEEKIGKKKNIVLGTFILDRFPDDLDHEVYDLHRTDEREASEEPHGSSYS